MTTLCETPRARRRRRVIFFTSAAFLVLLVTSVPMITRLLGSPANGAPVIGTHDVTIRNDRFDPPVIQVTPDTTVVWTFDDGGTAHNVVSDEWSSNTLTSGTFEQTFAEAGTYDYRCTLHWGMEGRVDVVAGR